MASFLVAPWSPMALFARVADRQHELNLQLNNTKRQNERHGGRGVGFRRARDRRPGSAPAAGFPGGFRASVSAWAAGFLDWFSGFPARFPARNRLGIGFRVIFRRR